MDKQKRTIFIIRLIAWIIAECVVPIVIFAVRFDLFSITKPTADAMGNVIAKTTVSINGWGIVSCIVLGVSVIQVLKELCESFTGFSLTKQIFKGFASSVIPLMVGYFVCYFLAGAINDVMFCLMAIALSRALAVPLNPLPQWKYETQQKENYDSAFNIITKALAKVFFKGGTP